MSTPNPNLDTWPDLGDAEFASLGEDSGMEGREMDFPIGTEPDQFPVLLGPPKTRPSLPGVFKFQTRIISLFLEYRDKLSVFWSEQQGKFFNLEHPVLGWVEARFEPQGGLEIRNIGSTYEAILSLQIKEPNSRFEPEDFDPNIIL